MIRPGLLIGFFTTLAAVCVYLFFADSLIEISMYSTSETTGVMSTSNNTLVQRRVRKDGLSRMSPVAATADVKASLRNVEEAGLPPLPPSLAHLAHQPPSRGYKNGSEWRVAPYGAAVHLPTPAERKKGRWPQLVNATAYSSEQDLNGFVEGSIEGADVPPLFRTLFPPNDPRRKSLWSYPPELHRHACVKMKPYNAANTKLNAHWKEKKEFHPSYRVFKRAYLVRKDCHPGHVGPEIALSFYALSTLNLDGLIVSWKSQQEEKNCFVLNWLEDLWRAMAAAYGATYVRAMKGVCAEEGYTPVAWRFLDRSMVASLDWFPSLRSTRRWWGFVRSVAVPLDPNSLLPYWRGGDNTPRILAFERVAFGRRVENWAAALATMERVFRSYWPQLGNSKKTDDSYFRGITMKKLVAEFQNADIFVSIHGAALTNTLFMRPSGTLIEFGAYTGRDLLNLVDDMDLRFNSMYEMVFWQRGGLYAAQRSLYISPVGLKKGDIQWFRLDLDALAELSLALIHAYYHLTPDFEANEALTDIEGHFST